MVVEVVVGWEDSGREEEVRRGMEELKEGGSGLRVNHSRDSMTKVGPGNAAGLATVASSPKSASTKVK